MTTPDHSQVDAAVAAYEAGVAALAQQQASTIADAQQALVAAQQQLASVQADDDAKTTQIATLTAQITELQRQLAAAPVAFQVGLDISTNTPSTGSYATEAAAARALFGTLGAHAKMFDGGAGLPVALTQAQQSTYPSAVGEHTPVICIKRYDLPGSWIDSLTAPVVLVADQESDRIVDPATTTAAYQQLDTLRKASPNGHLVKLCLDLTTYKQVWAPQSGRAAADYAAPLAGIIDLIGADCYVLPVFGKAWDPAHELDWLVSLAKQLGIPWCLPEFGVMNPKNGTEADAAANYAKLTGYCRANGAVWANYWWGSGTNGNWRHPAGAPLTVALQSDIATTN